MPRIASWIAAASTAALLAGSLSGAPAYAEDVPPEPVAATINLRYAAVDSTVTVTGASTVDDAITELDLAVDGDDRVSPARHTAVIDGMSLVIDVVSVTKSNKKQTVKYQTIRKKTKSMMKGHKKVVRHGRTGKITRTYLTTTVNGEPSTVVTKKVNRKVRNKIVKVGTSRLNLARWKKWHKIARCESGGRWHINTGNGYYGGLQFNLATWRSAGGNRFAKYPHRATKREQIHVANRLYAKRGFSPWSCRP
jgi:uncharacterized protein YabE (DUF348 family)